MPRTPDASELVGSGAGPSVFRGLLAGVMCLTTSTRKDAHGMLEETYFEDQSTDIHELQIYQI
jgi:hypothetical protein